MVNPSVLEYIMEKFDGKIIDDLDIIHYKIDGKPYDIQKNDRREWSCDCPAFKFRRRHKIKYCKTNCWNNLGEIL